VEHTVEELLLVVGDLELSERQRDVSLVRPSLRPFYVNHAMTESEKQELKDEVDAKTWAQMRADLKRVMQKVKAERDSDLDRIGLKDWDIPKVVFVEARVANRDWVFIPNWKPR
jgi:hypothetical protein